MLNTVWNSTDSVVTQRIDRPWRTNAAGPSRNSPLPIEAPSTMTPGPTTPTQPKPWGLGGIGSSAGSHGSSPERASGEAEDAGFARSCTSSTVTPWEAPTTTTCVQYLRTESAYATATKS